MHNIDNIKCLIVEWKPIVICLVETHVDSQISEKEIKIEGYQSEKCLTSNRRTGGILVYVKNGYNYKILRSDKIEPYLWTLSIELNILNNKYCVTSFYHPPQRNDSLFLEYFENYLEEIMEYDGNIYIGGDFNYDLLKDTYYSKKIKEMIHRSGLYQIVNKPTRVTDNSSTLIDYIITNNKNTLHEVHETPRISDHSILSITVKNRYSKGYTTIKKRCFSNYSASSLQNLIRNSNWNNNTTDVNVLSNSLTSSLEEVIDELCPEIEINIPEKHIHNKWITYEIINLMKERDRDYKRAIFSKCEDTWNTYKESRNRITTMIRNEKQNYFHRIIDENKSNPKQMWKNLKTILPSNHKVAQDKIKFEDIEMSNESEIAEKFNVYFVQSIKEITDSISNSTNNEYVLDLVDSHPPFNKFKEVSMMNLRTTVLSLKNTVGVNDNLSTRVIKDAFDVVGNRFLDVVNLSLSIGTFPERWKTSYIVPVPKIQNSNQCTNFRPINTVPVYEKILEVVVKNQLMEYCDENSVIVGNQSGFRKNHSCESVLLNITDEWYRAMDENYIILAVFLDFKRAFETINRDLLIKKLEKIGMGGTVLKWFQSYLHNRQQKVKYKKCMSQSIQNNFGVPQGTVLGPILFILYVNDIIKCVKNCKISLFADDTMIYIIGKDIENMFNVMNTELQNIFKWLCCNDLCINVDKSKYMLIGSNDKIATIDSKLCIKINSNKIERVNEIKYLGVILDQNLKFNSHADYVMKKMSQKTNFLYRVGSCLSMPTRILLYKSLIAPHIDFCTSLLLNVCKGKVQNLQKIQNKAMRNILKCNKFTPITMMNEVLGFMNVQQRIVFKSLDVIYKIKKKMLPNYLSNQIKFNCDIHKYETRNAGDFSIDTARKSKTQSSLYFKGLKYFNALPREIKNCNYYNDFRNRLKLYVRNHY